MSNFAEKEKFFKELYENAIKDVNDGWCYVRDVSMNNYSETTIDSAAVEKVLNPYNGAVEAWKRFLKKSTYSGERNIYSAMYELHILPAIAVAIAIRVFVCPEAEIMLECESSKYSEGEIDYWWAISSIATNGIALDSKAKYKKYLSRLEKGEAYATAKAAASSKKEAANNGKKPQALVDTSGKTAAEWKKIFDYETIDDGLIITIYKGDDVVVEIPAVIGKKPVAAIDGGIFRWNHSARELVIPNDTIAFTGKAFSGYKTRVMESTGFKFDADNCWKTKTLKDGTIKLMFYCRSDAEEVIIPHTIGGKTVTILGKRLFKGHSEVKAIQLPDTIVELEAECLSDVRMTKLELPDSVKKIGYEAVSCEWVDVPATVEEICGGAFSNALNVIIRGNPKLVKNLTIFRMESNVYAEPGTDAYNYCKEKLGPSSWFKVKVHPLSEAPQKL